MRAVQTSALFVALALGVTLRASSNSDIRHRDESGGLSPTEIRTALEASRAVFAAQAEERREAESAGLNDLVADFKALHESIQGLAMSNPPSQSGGESAATPSGQTSEPTTATASAVADAEAGVRGNLDRIDARTEAIEAKIAALESPRQRAVARTALTRLIALREEARVALATPSDERPSRMADLARRLAIIDADGTGSASHVPQAPTAVAANKLPLKKKGTHPYSPNERQSRGH